MNVRKRTGLMGETGTAPKNTVNDRRGKPSQVEPIKNSVSKPKAQGYAKLKGAVNG